MRKTKVVCTLGPAADSEEIIRTVKYLAPTFGGINLEDISAPRCFEIERRLRQELDIPVFHDDQHGTAIVVSAGILNALRLVNKELGSARFVINGAGSAGISIATLLMELALMQLFVEMHCWEMTLSKLLVQVLVIAANYLLSRFLIFVRKD